MRRKEGDKKKRKICDNCLREIKGQAHQYDEERVLCHECWKKMVVLLTSSKYQKKKRGRITFSLLFSFSKPKEFAAKQEILRCKISCNKLSLIYRELKMLVVKFCQVVDNYFLCFLLPHLNPPPPLEGED